MVIVNYMKKIVIFVVLILVILVAYLALSKKELNQDGVQASVISKFFKGKAEVATPAKILETSTGRPPITPVIQRFNSKDKNKIQEIYIDGLKKQVPSTPVPR